MKFSKIITICTSTLNNIKNIIDGELDKRQIEIEKHIKIKEEAQGKVVDLLYEVDDISAIKSQIDAIKLA